MVKHASYTVDRNVKESLEDNYKEKKKQLSNLLKK